MSFNDTVCVQVINAYEDSQLNTLCIDSSRFDISIASSDEFYGSIANANDLDQLWVLICGALVFFMQTGFTMLESGSVKIGNVQNILFKNMMDACVGAIGFYLFGYAVAYGDGSGNVFIGSNNVALSSSSNDWNHFFFQWAFAATSSTIVSGSVAERCSLSGYFTYTIILTVWVYPVIVHWFWSKSGWLSPFNPDGAVFPGGVIDFAGSGVVHMVGGWSGLMGAIMLGPRINRFKYALPENKNKSKSLASVSASNSVPAAGEHNSQKQQESHETDSNLDVMPVGLTKQEQKHWLALKAQHELGNNVPFQVLGCFILWFGWYGFNPGSTLGANGLMDLASKVAVNTTLSAAGGGIIAALFGRVMEHYFSLPRVCNGILAGLVSITAGCSVVDNGEALGIGVVGAFVYYFASQYLKRIQVDDPLDAWAVHGCCGMWGLISVGLFSTSENIEFAGYNDILINSTKGYRFSLQLFGVFIIIVWIIFWIGGLFAILNYFDILRVHPDIERAGLDAHEHGGPSYDYKKPYANKSKDNKKQLSINGTSSTDVNKDTFKSKTLNLSLDSGKRGHKKLRPHATPHISKFNPYSNKSNDIDDIDDIEENELVPINS